MQLLCVPLSEPSAYISKSVISASMRPTKDAARRTQKHSNQMAKNAIKLLQAQVAQLQGDSGPVESRAGATAASRGVCRCVT